MRSWARRSRVSNSSGLMIPSASAVPSWLLPITRQGFPGLLQNRELVVCGLQGNLAGTAKLLRGLTRVLRRGSGILRGCPGTFGPAALLLPELAGSFLFLAERLSSLAGELGAFPDLFGDRELFR